MGNQKERDLIVTTLTSLAGPPFDHSKAKYHLIMGAMACISALVVCYFMLSYATKIHDGG